MLAPVRAFAKEFRAIRDAMRLHAREAWQAGGLHPAAQALDLVSLRFGPGKLPYGDYYNLRLYRRELDRAEKRHYVGNKALASRTHWDLLANDKLLGYAIMHAHGARTPRVRAVVHPFRRYLGARTLASDADLRTFLETEAMPMVSKPIDGMFSRGFVVLESRDDAGRTLHLHDGRAVAIDDFVAERRGWSGGTIFQELLRPHPDIAAQVSPRLCTLRIIVTLDERGPRLFRAIWKIAAAANGADNYWHGGNMMARLDQRTGAVEELMTGLGPRFRKLDTHPATGRSVRGFRVPCYREAVALTLQLAPAFPGLPIQAWDVAITPEGPVPMEVNNIGSLWVPQTVDDRGLLADADFRRAMARVVG